MQRLTWQELAKVPVGARVVFVTSWDIYPYCIVDEGTVGTVRANKDNTWVLPDNEDIKATLKDWDGDIQLSQDLVGECYGDLSPVALQGETAP